MSFTREEWTRKLLKGFSNNNPLEDLVAFIVGWSVHETVTNQGASFNLLNTTWDMQIPGQTNFNSIGVRNYPNFQAGIDATVRTIESVYYPFIAQCLTANANIGDNPSENILRELDTWCGTCGYGEGFVTLGKQHLNDTFEYGEVPTMATHQPTDIQKQEGLKAWGAYSTSVGKSAPNTNTGIFDSWLFDWVNFYRFYGSPIDYEQYDEKNWNGETIVAQHFTGARAEYNPKTGKILWIGSSGVLNA